MSHNPFPWLLVVLTVAALTACGKTETPVTEMAGAAPEGASQPVPDTISSVNAMAQTDVKPAALSMADGLALAQRNNCFACHQIDTKLVGPAWIDVAKKYKGVVDAEHMLVIKVSTGSVGNWGDMPMPAMAPAVKEEDIRALVKFVLSLEK